MGIVNEPFGTTSTRPSSQMSPMSQSLTSLTSWICPRRSLAPESTAGSLSLKLIWMVLRSDLSLEGSRNPLGHDLALVYDAKPVRQPVRLFHVLGGQEDGGAFLIELLDVLPEFVATLGIQSRGRLHRERAPWDRRPARWRGPGASSFRRKRLTTFCPRNRPRSTVLRSSTAFWLA